MISKRIGKLWLAVLLFIISASLVAAFVLIRPSKSAKNYTAGSFVNAMEAAQTVRTVSAAETQIDYLTEMTYQYFYTLDEQVETVVEDAPSFMIGLTKSDIERILPEWDVLEFSPEQVLMQKKVEGKSGQYYTIGEENGYVAVFYREPVNGASLKQVTSVPVISLPEEKKKMIELGIDVDGEDRLIRVLEDYDS